MNEPADTPASPARPHLTARERALLDFERDWQAHRGRKEEAIRERFGVSAARYYQLLGRLVDQPCAVAYDPLVVARLRRRRDRRLRERTAKALGQRHDR